MAFDINTSHSMSAYRGTVKAGYVTSDVTGTDADELQSQFMQVDNGASDLAIPLGGLTTAQIISIVSDFEVSFKINGSAVGVACKELHLVGASVTAITVSNASGSQATLQILMGGT